MVVQNAEEYEQILAAYQLHMQTKNILDQANAQSHQNRIPVQLMQVPKANCEIMQVEGYPVHPDSAIALSRQNQLEIHSHSNPAVSNQQLVNMHYSNMNGQPIINSHALMSAQPNIYNDGQPDQAASLISSLLQLQAYHSQMSDDT